MKDRAEQFAALARHLEAQPADPQARVGYDLFADALVWSDEMPVLPADSLAAVASLRGLLRYRTSLILSTPEDRYRPAWEEGMRQFPRWPGFLPDRRDARWAATFRTLRDRGMAKWEEFEDRFADTPPAVAPASSDPAAEVPATKTARKLISRLRFAPIWKGTP